MDSNYIITPSGSFISEDELYHHGIKGMKWGVRRYQNKDGTLTAAGRSRYSTVADAKEAYRKAKKASADKYSTAAGGIYGGRFTVTRNQRKDYSRDVQAYNNSLAQRTGAKYDYKITKAQQKGKNNKVAELRVKQELAVKRQKNRASIANAYIRDTYENQSLGKQIVRGLIGGNKGTVSALVKAGYSDRGAKVMSYIFNDNINLAFAYAKSDRDTKKRMMSQKSYAGKKRRKSEDLSSMSNDELRKKVNRMNNEQRYIDLTRSSSVTSKVIDGIDRVTKIGGNVNQIYKTSKGDKDPYGKLAGQGINAMSQTSRLAKKIDTTARTSKDTKVARKKLEKMSDAELAKTVERLDLERQYTRLKKADVQRGKIRVGDVLDIAGDVLGIGASAVGIAVGIKKLMNK